MNRLALNIFRDPSGQLSLSFLSVLPYARTLKKINTERITREFRLCKLDTTVILFYSRGAPPGKCSSGFFAGPTSDRWLDFVILVIFKWYVNENDLRGEIAFFSYDICCHAVFRENAFG